jgi:hypothetical protein
MNLRSIFLCSTNYDILAEILGIAILINKFYAIIRIL